MSELLNRRLALLSERTNLSLLEQCLHGIERECLRVTGDARLAQTPHPEALGAALTHSQITTDYSESLLEFITPALADPVETLESLDKIHRFAYSKLGNEFLWSPSMPCPLPAEEDIPIAYYGTSNIGKLKYVYRQGLALRYGKTMQCIAGIHYNFSLPDSVWPLLQQTENFDGDARDYQSHAYIALIRNFRRYSWLLMYLFGASPALNASFLRGRPHKLETLSAEIRDRKLVVEVEPAEGLPTAWVDRGQVRQAFFNVIRNAIQAMGGSGVLRISFEVSDRLVGAVFQDTGPGIPPGQMGNLFEPFQTGRPDGHGMGLMIVQRIVRDHGGTVQVDSLPGGTRIQLNFQRDDQRIRLLAAPAATEEPVAR